MYVTRPLSRYVDDPKSAAEAPPEGPGSGFLVVVDETEETDSPCCWGLCMDREMGNLPFPQNRHLELRPKSSPVTVQSLSKSAGSVVDSVVNCFDGKPSLGKATKAPAYAMLVPVVGQPLSSGRYYVVHADGKHRGMVSACSKEEDKTACCFCSCVKDVKPRDFDSADVYQQVVVQQLPCRNKDKGFEAVAVPSDGFPPKYLRKKGWKVNTMRSPTYELADAQGVNSALRRRMPYLGTLGIAEKSSRAVVVGRWYVPFIFVKADGESSLKDQSRRCTFYEMTMEQSWEQIYSCERDPGSTPAEVSVTARVRRSTALLGGTSVVPQEEGGAVWFRTAGTTATVGLDVVVWERMRWELERGGWVEPSNGNGDEEMIERVERRGDGVGQWDKFRCYVLVEKFLLKRMDGSLALTCAFRHTDKIKATWL